MRTLQPHFVANGIQPSVALSLRCVRTDQAAGAAIPP